jgi:hypothetical protein
MLHKEEGGPAREAPLILVLIFLEAVLEILLEINLPVLQEIILDRIQINLILEVHKAVEAE